MLGAYFAMGNTSEGVLSGEVDCLSLGGSIMNQFMNIWAPAARNHDRLRRSQLPGERDFRRSYFRFH